MADNLQYYSYSGATALGDVGTDDMSFNGTAVHVQIIKLIYGALGAGTLVSSAAGSQLPIQGTLSIAAGSITLTGAPLVSISGTAGPGSLGTMAIGNYPGTVSPGSLGTVAIGNYPGTVSPGSLGTVTLGSAQRTPGLARGTVAGTVTAGAYSLSFAQTGGFGTVLGVVIGAGETVTFTAPSRDTLGSVVYNPGAGTLMIAEVR